MTAERSRRVCGAERWEDDAVRHALSGVDPGNLVGREASSAQSVANEGSTPKANGPVDPTRPARWWYRGLHRLVMVFADY